MLIPKWIPGTQVCQWTKRFLKKKVFKIMFVGFLSSDATIEPLESSGNFKNNVDIDSSGEKQEPENQVLNCPLLLRIVDDGVVEDTEVPVDSNGHGYSSVQGSHQRVVASLEKTQDLTV